MNANTPKRPYTSRIDNCEAAERFIAEQIDAIV